MSVTEIPVPEEEALRAKTAKKLDRRSTAFAVLGFAFALLIVLFTVGACVCVILLNFASEGELLLILLASFGAAAPLSALGAMLFSKASQRAASVLSDYEERCDSPESFFVGEGTLATFQREALLFHSEKREISVPYADIAFHAVCMRSRPAPEGNFLAVAELPARYLQKDAGEEKAFVEFEMKDRLLETLARHGLEIEGELPEGNAEKKRYEPMQKFYRPDRAGQRRALLTIVLFSLIILAAVPVMIFWELAFGICLAVFGAVFLVRAAFSYFGARAPLVVYAEGIFGQSTEGGKIFLRWEDIVTMRPAREEPVLGVKCVCGGYTLTLPDGAWEYLLKFAPKKCGQEEGPCEN